MLLYLDNRYRNIVGHQGLLHYVDQFPYSHSHEAMELEMQRPKTQ
jgi:hypothetical protein